MDKCGCCESIERLINDPRNPDISGLCVGRQMQYNIHNRRAHSFKSRVLLDELEVILETNDESKISQLLERAHVDPHRFKDVVATNHTYIRNNCPILSAQLRSLPHITPHAETESTRQAALDIETKIISYLCACCQDADASCNHKKRTRGNMRLVLDRLLENTSQHRTDDSVSHSLFLLEKVADQMTPLEYKATVEDTIAHLRSSPHKRHHMFVHGAHTGAAIRSDTEAEKFREEAYSFKEDLDEDDEDDVSDDAASQGTVESDIEELVIAEENPHEEDTVSEGSNVEELDDAQSVGTIDTEEENSDQGDGEELADEDTVSEGSNEGETVEETDDAQSVGTIDTEEEENPDQGDSTGEESAEEVSDEGLTVEETDDAEEEDFDQGQDTDVADTVDEGDSVTEYTTTDVDYTSE